MRETDNISSGAKFEDSRGCVVGVYASFAEAETAIHALRDANFDAAQISLILIARTGVKEAVDLGSLDQDLVQEIAQEAGLGGVLGFLGGAALTLLTGIGAVWLLGAIVGLVAGTALGGFAGLGVHEEHIEHYEQCVKSGKALLIIHGSPAELRKARTILDRTNVVELRDHP